MYLLQFNLCVHKLYIEKICGLASRNNTEFSQALSRFSVKVGIESKWMYKGYVVLFSPCPHGAFRGSSQSSHCYSFKFSLVTKLVSCTIGLA